MKNNDFERRGRSGQLAGSGREQKSIVFLKKVKWKITIFSAGAGPSNRPGAVGSGKGMKRVTPRYRLWKNVKTEFAYYFHCKGRHRGVPSIDVSDIFSVEISREKEKVKKRCRLWKCKITEFAYYFCCRGRQQDVPSINVRDMLPPEIIREMKKQRKTTQIMKTHKNRICLLFLWYRSPLRCAKGKY